MRFKCFLSSGVPGGKNDLAMHIAMLFQQRIKDGVFFVGTEINQEWLTHVATLEPLLFRSSSPIFMPKAFLHMVKLRLDSNIVFYEKDINGKYHLMDIFAIKGGTPIEIEIGS